MTTSVLSGIVSRQSSTRQSLAQSSIDVHSSGDEGDLELDLDDGVALVEGNISCARPDNGTGQSSSRNGVPEKILKHAKETFTKWDYFKTGEISTGDLRPALQEIELYLTDHEIVAYLEEIDSWGDGKITMQAFINLVTEKLSERNADGEILELFGSIDRQQKGYIPRESLKKVLTKKWTPYQGKEARLTADQFEELMDETGFRETEDIDYKELTRKLRALCRGEDIG